MTTTTDDNTIETTQDDSPNEFPAKLLAKLPTGFAEEADSMSDEELKKTIVASENNIANIEHEKEKDVKLNAAKEIAKDLTLPYRDAKNCQAAKIKYCIHLLKSKGVLA